MTIIENLQPQAWIIALIVAAIISVLTFLEIKGTVLLRIGLSLVRGIIFFLLFYIPLFPQPRIAGAPALPIAGIVLLVFGILLAVVGSRQLLQTDLHGVTGVPDKIITTGLYGVIRHPVNLGLMFTFAGWYMIWSGVYSLLFLAAFLVVFVLETLWEEKNLEKVFGDGYKEYKQRVGMFFPKIKKQG